MDANGELPKDATCTCDGCRDIVHNPSSVIVCKGCNKVLCDKCTAYRVYPDWTSEKIAHCYCRTCLGGAYNVETHVLCHECKRNVCPKEHMHWCKHCNRYSCLSHCKDVTTVVPCSKCAHRMAVQSTHGSITVIAGPMYSGKTTRMFELWDAADKKDGCRVCIANIHGREELQLDVHSRNGRTLPALRMRRLYEFFNTREYNNGVYQHIFIDEGQFFPDLVDFCDRMANNGSHVVVTLLNRNLTGGAFPHTLQMYARAEHVEHLLAYCDYCDPEHLGERCAAFTVRVSPITAEHGYIGYTKDDYKVACRSCYLKNNFYLSE